MQRSAWVASIPYPTKKLFYHLLLLLQGTIQFTIFVSVSFLKVNCFCLVVALWLFNLNKKPECCFLQIIFYLCRKNMMDNIQIEFIEEKVIEIYNVTKDELMSYDKHKNISMARMMCIYILHKDCGISSSYLSKRYHRSRRVIFSICQKMNTITNTYIKDKEQYTYLTKLIFHS